MSSGSPASREDAGSDRAVEATLAELMALSKRVEAGDQDAQARIAQILDHHPSVWSICGDLSAAAESALIRAVCGDNSAMTAMLMRNRDNLKVQLLGNQPTLLEKLAVQRVIAVWMFTQYLDLRCAEIAAKGGRIGELGRLQIQAEMRWHRALKSLELVRKSAALRTLDRQAAVAATPRRKRSASVADDAQCSQMVSAPPTPKRPSVNYRKSGAA